MFFDRTTLTARTWAIPSLSALLILHHDFKPPRFVNVSRLIWRDNAVEIRLRYGMCNLSGQVIGAIDLVLTLHRDGTVSALPGRPVQDGHAATQEKLLCFLTGEIARERIRWEQDFAAWREYEWVEENVRTLFVLVTALVAQPIADMPIEAVKLPLRQDKVQRVRLHGERAEFTFEQYGEHGITMHIAAYNRSVASRQVRQKHDLRIAWGAPPKGFVRTCKLLISRIVACLLLPLDFLLHVVDYYRPDHVSSSSQLIDHLPPSSIVDHGNGDD